MLRATLYFRLKRRLKRRVVLFLISMPSICLPFNSNQRFPWEIPQPSWSQWSHPTLRCWVAVYTAMASRQTPPATQAGGYSTYQTTLPLLMVVLFANRRPPVLGYSLLRSGGMSYLMPSVRVMLWCGRISVINMATLLCPQSGLPLGVLLLLLLLPLQALSRPCQ